MEKPNADWGGECYDEFAIAMNDGGFEVMFGPFRSIDYARQSLADMKTWDTYKNKKLYIVKRSVCVSSWRPY
jgi:hypothetical protein